MSEPKEGDIVVHKRNVGRLSRYDVSITGRPPQYTIETYEQALNRADSFAREARVDVWYTDDGVRFRRVTSRRLRKA